MIDHAAPDFDAFSGDALVRQEALRRHDAGCVSLEAEIPEVLFEGMRSFLQLNPEWDQYSVIGTALAGFLFQNGCQDDTVTQHYLDALFQRR